MKRPSRVVARCADWDSLMVYTCRRCTTSVKAVRAFWNKVFPEQWIERGAPTARLAHSPDLNQ